MKFHHNSNFYPKFFSPRFFENHSEAFFQFFEHFSNYFDTTYSFLKFIKITLILICSIFFLHFFITWIILQNFLEIIFQVSKVLKINYKFLQMFQKLISLLAICSSNFLQLIWLFSRNYFRFLEDVLSVFLSVFATFSEFSWSNYYSIFVTYSAQ